MQGKRIFWFTVSIAIGLALGLVYGWLIQPLFYSEVSPDRLRVDYQADYVLMVAEVYAKDQDIRESADQLEVLGKPTRFEVCSASDTDRNRPGVQLSGY